MGIISFIFALAEDMLLAAIPAVGFAMVFNVPQRALRWCALLGAIGHGSRMIMMSAGFNIEWATFLAALLVGSIGIQWSRWYLASSRLTPTSRLTRDAPSAMASVLLCADHPTLCSSELR